MGEVKDTYFEGAVAICIDIKGKNAPGDGKVGACAAQNTL